MSPHNSPLKEALKRFGDTKEIETSSDTGPIMVRLSEVEPEEVHWLWPSRIAKGKLILLIGDPGLGKSFVTLDVAARLSKAALWPDGRAAPQGDVILLSAEDGIADTIRPRVDRLGGNPQHIHVLKAIRSKEGEKPFCIASDLLHLEAAIQDTKACLVIVDPLSAYLGSTESYKDAEVRGVLAPLQALADKTGAAVLAVMHMTKDSSRKAIYRAPGSIGFIGAARIALAVAEDPENKDRRLLLPIKANICARPDSLAFTVRDDVLQWEPDPILGVNTDDILAGPSNAGDRDEHQDADQFLKEFLVTGEVAAVEAFKEARKNGISDRTLKRAKARLKIRTRHDGQPGFRSAWYWSLPDSPKGANSPPKEASLHTVAPFGEHIENSQVLMSTSPKGATSQIVAPFDGSLRPKREPGDDTDAETCLQVFPGAREVRE